MTRSRRQMVLAFGLLQCLHGVPVVLAQSKVLPAEAAVRVALTESPRLRIAHEAIPVGEAQEQKLRAGMHEWEIGAMSQQRTDPLGQRYTEQEYALQRGLRWPWKAILDRRLGASIKEAGPLSYADAWHEAGRNLLDSWFSWLDAEHSVRLMDEQLQALVNQERIVSRRVEAGDSAKLELQLASIETQRSQAQRHHLALAAVQARETLQKDFPALTLTSIGEPDLPSELQESDAVWLARITGDNHEVELAEAHAEGARIAAVRAARNRLADPTVAMHYSDNLDGNRRLLGLTVSMPLGGRYRSADAALARSAARGAASAAEQTRDAVHADARSVIAAARLTVRGWQELAAADSQMQQTAESTARGYALGEFDIAVLLAVRRQALEARQQAVTAQLLALRAQARVLLDAHQLWVPPHHDENHDH
jgi:outer membrane protein, heavy metal efflux system